MRGLWIGAASLCLALPLLPAMNVNLARPYDPKCSPPQNPLLAFFSPEAENLLFAGQPAVKIICQAGVRGLGLRWTLHRNMVQLPFREGDAQPLGANRFEVCLDLHDLPAGFYDLRVKLDTGGPKAEEGVCTFGWKADQMALCESKPKDFAAFWEKAVHDSAAIPLDPRVESEVEIFDAKAIGTYNLQQAALPADYDPSGHRTEEVESFKISFAGPGGGRVYGWVAKPRGAGPFPAMLVLPGAGFAARPRPLEHARHGYYALDIQVHGQEVDLAKYDRLPGYYDHFVYEPPEEFYFHDVYLRAVRAVDYLASLPEVRKDGVVAVGGSQGGRLGIVVTALNPQVKAVVSCIANSPNDPHRRWVAQCNQSEGASAAGKKSNGLDLTGAPPPVTDAAGRCWAYYDPMNFAPQVRCPVLLNMGLIDPVSPPYSVYALFLRLGSTDKKIVPLPGLGHDWCAEFDREAWRWLSTSLEKEQIPAK